MFDAQCGMAKFLFHCVLFSETLFKQQPQPNQTQPSNQTIQPSNQTIQPSNQTKFNQATTPLQTKHYQNQTQPSNQTIQPSNQTNSTKQPKKNQTKHYQNQTQPSNQTTSTMQIWRWLACELLGHSKSSESNLHVTWCEFSPNHGTPHHAKHIDEIPWRDWAPNQTRPEPISAKIKLNKNQTQPSNQTPPNQAQPHNPRGNISTEKSARIILTKLNQHQHQPVRHSTSR